jgi:hypothetical protein
MTEFGQEAAGGHPEKVSDLARSLQWATKSVICDFPSDELQPVLLQADEADVILIYLEAGRRRQKAGLRKLPAG